MLVATRFLLLSGAQLVLGATCSAGFTEYTDVTAWVEALGTGAGKHCLQGSSTTPQAVTDKWVKVTKGVAAEAHHVEFSMTASGTANALGGLVFVDQLASFTATNADFTGARGAGMGGAMFVNINGNITCSTCKFEDNRADATNGNGGALFANAGGSIACNNCTFTSNSADLYGGAIFNNAMGTIGCNTCTFTGNTASQAGSTIYNNVGGVVELVDSTITGGADPCYGYDCSASIAGGGGGGGASASPPPPGSGASRSRLHAPDGLGMALALLCATGLTYHGIK